MWFISLTLGVVILSLWLTWRKRKFSYFSNLNIPGPPPSILFGNFWEIYHEGHHQCIKRWIDEYGKVFGYYYGIRPVLIVADLDTLKQIQQKDFTNFSSRPELHQVGTSSLKLNRYSITRLNGKKWKDLRSTITPTFTVSKLKQMSYIVDGAVNELVEAASKKASQNKTFDIYPLYQNLTMDVIARTSLGIHSTAQQGKDDIFLKLAKMIFTLNVTYLTVLTFSFTEIIEVFAFIRNVITSMKNKGKNPRVEMLERVRAAIKVRRDDPTTRRPDVLQLMIDAKRNNTDVSENSLTAGDNEEVIETGTTKAAPSKSVNALSDEEIEQNATVFLLAGFETTSTALAFLTHCLSHNPDVQDKVREEINSNIPEGKNVSYEDVHNLQYLDKVINETLRMFPPITYFINRVASDDTYIDGKLIPKGVAIQVPVYNLHYDPTIWDDPETFDPERFSPEEKRNRNPMAFQPFGAGPRNCVGMRFAQMEMKMAITKLLMNYRIKPKGKKEDFKVNHTIVTLRPLNGVDVHLEKI